MAEPGIRKLNYRRAIGTREFFEEMLHDQPDNIYRACVDCRKYLVDLIINGEIEVLRHLVSFDYEITELEKENPDAAKDFREYFKHYPNTLRVYSWERKKFNGLEVFQISVICEVDEEAGELIAHQEVPFVSVAK